MEFFRIRKDIPFMRHALVFNIISLITFLLAVFFLDHQGPAFLDRVHRRHADGSQLCAGTRSAADAQAAGGDGFADPQVQNFGSSRDVLIRVPLSKDTETSKVGERVMASLARSSGGRRAPRRRSTPPQLKRVEFVGPQVGKELAEDGALACCW
jgi:preprotein translocase subunit SecF